MDFSAKYLSLYTQQLHCHWLRGEKKQCKYKTFCILNCSKYMSSLKTTSMYHSKLVVSNSPSPVELPSSRGFWDLSEFWLVFGHWQQTFSKNTLSFIVNYLSHKPTMPTCSSTRLQISGFGIQFWCLSVWDTT